MTTSADQPRRGAGALLGALLALVLVVAGACGDSDTTSAAPADQSTTATPDPSTSAGGTDAEPEPYERRLVLLGEESVLADVLALGVEPVASSATVDTVGFQGIPDHDTTDVEVLPVTTLSLERLAALNPEVIITFQFVVDAVGADALDEMAEVWVVPDGRTSAEQIRFVGDVLGRPERATELVAELDAATERAGAAVGDDCTVSVAAIYPGPSVAAFVDGPWVVPSSIQSAGCTLDPGPTDAEPDANGRAFLSLEQLGLLDAPRIVLMQSDTVEGEGDAVDEIMAHSLWQQLPAVQAGAVIEVDRLGYPGIEGRIRFLDRLGELLG